MILKPLSYIPQPQRISLFSEDFIPRDADVIIGRGRKCYYHIGNERLRNMIDEMLEQYSSCASKSKKSDMISSIVSRIRMDCGYFLKQDQETGLYFDVGDATAREKISQQFRDTLRSSSLLKKNKLDKKKKRKTCSSSNLKHVDLSLPKSPTRLAINSVDNSELAYEAPIQKENIVPRKNAVVRKRDFTGLTKLERQSFVSDEDSISGDSNCNRKKCNQLVTEESIDIDIQTLIRSLPPDSLLDNNPSEPVPFHRIMEFEYKLDYCDNFGDDGLLSCTSFECDEDDSPQPANTNNKNFDDITICPSQYHNVFSEPYLNCIDVAA